MEATTNELKKHTRYSGAERVAYRVLIIFTAVAVVFVNKTKIAPGLARMPLLSSQFDVLIKPFRQLRLLSHEKINSHKQFKLIRAMRRRKIKFKLNATHR